MASAEVAPDHAGREGEPMPKVAPPEGPHGGLNVRALFSPTGPALDLQFH